LGIAQSAEQFGRSIYPVDLPTVLRLAGAQNLRIATAQARADHQDAEALSAYERFLPTLSAEYLFAKHDGLTQSTEGEFVDVTKQSTALGGRLRLTWDLHQTFFDALSARQRSKATRLLSQGITDSVLLEVGDAYFELEFVAASVRIAQGAITVSEDLVQQTSGKIDQGIGYKADLLRARAQLAHDSLNLYYAQQEQYLASARLANLLSLQEPIQLLPLDTSVTARSYIDTTRNLASWLAEARDTRPELRATEATLLASQWRRRSALWGPLLPEISGSVFSSGFGPTASDLSDAKRYDVSVMWTIGPGGLLDLGRIRQTSSLSRIALLEHQQVLQSIDEEVVRTFGRVMIQGRTLFIAQRGLGDARASLQLSQERRELGIGLALEVIDAGETLARAEMDYSKTVTKYNKAQLAALAAMGLIQQRVE
jgi:outer membrane protein TolC